MTRWWIGEVTPSPSQLAAWGIDRQARQLDLEALALGDRVYGDLPVPLVWRLYRRGARYFHVPGSALDPRAQCSEVQAFPCEYLVVRPDHEVFEC